MKPLDTRPWLPRLPEWFFHFGPVSIGIFCLTISLADFSVFKGFDEREPGTYLSLLLMSLCFFFCFSAIRNSELNDPSRRLAGLLSLLIGIAIADESLNWHETIGRRIQDSLVFLPRRLLHYTDDAIILIGAILVGYYLFRLFRRSGHLPSAKPYLACLIILAVGHGLLDVISHGPFLMENIVPNVTERGALNLEQQLGSLEEYFKVWAVWFAFLLIQVLFFRQKPSWQWPMLVVIGTLLSAIGTWTITDPAYGIPYIMVGRPFFLIRNYPSLLTLSFIWLTWTTVSWILFQNQPKKRELSGLLFLTPIFGVLGQFISPESLGQAIARVANGIAPLAYFGAHPIRHPFLLIVLLGPGLLLGLGLGMLLKRYPLALTLGFLTAPILWRFLSPDWSFQLSELIFCGGIIAPLAALLLLGKVGWRGLPCLLFLILSAFIPHPAWSALGASCAVLLACRELPEQLYRNRTWVLTVTGFQIALSILVLAAEQKPRIPNYRFLSRDTTLFRTYYQPTGEFIGVYGSDGNQN